MQPGTEPGAAPGAELGVVRRFGSSACKMKEHDCSCSHKRKGNRFLHDMRQVLEQVPINFFFLFFNFANLNKTPSHGTDT